MLINQGTTVQTCNRKTNITKNNSPTSAARQTRFTDDIIQLGSDSQDEQDAIVGNVNARIKLTLGESTESGQITRVKVFDADYKKIAVLVKVNETEATATIDTGSPVTVTSKDLFSRMGDEYEESS